VGECTCCRTPHTKPAISSSPDNPVCWIGFADTTATAIGFGGELPLAQLPQTMDYSTTLLVGCGGSLAGGGADPLGSARRRLLLKLGRDGTSSFRCVDPDGSLGGGEASSS
jgi:hypothetical protein